MEEYIKIVYPLLVADSEFVHGGHKTIQQSYLDYRRAIKGRPSTKIAESDEEGNLWHVDDFKEWLRQIKP